MFIKDIVEESGNSTIHIVFFDKSKVHDTIEYLEKMECDSEISHLPHLIAVNVPKEIDYYKDVFPYLKRGFDNDLWEFQEACLAHKR